jgi:hypothetical protein
MKTYLKFHTTRTGTEAVSIHTEEKQIYVFLLNNKGQIIAMFENYEGLKDAAPWDLTGTEAEKVLIEITTHMDKYNCLANLNYNSELRTIFLAKKVQAKEGFYYQNPIHELIETHNLKGIGKYIWQDYFEAQDRIRSLQQTVDNFRIYGTDSPKQIEKIKAQREKEERAAEKKRQKQIKNKAAEIKRLAKKEGYKYAAIIRNYTNKGRKYLGESVEFRTEKPQTRSYYEITETSLPVIAEKLLFS